MMQESGKPQITSNEPEHSGSRRDPEERKVASGEEAKEKSLDKTLADSFPTSDPPSSIPDPATGAVSEEIKRKQIEEELADLPVGSWAALTIEGHQLVGVGVTRDAAVASARGKGHNILNLVKVRAQSPLGLVS
jgi:hypothetical protein